jgi:hypothetical protein
MQPRVGTKYKRIFKGRLGSCIFAMQGSFLPLARPQTSLSIIFQVSKRPALFCVASQLSSAVLLYGGDIHSEELRNTATILLDNAVTKIEVRLGRTRTCNPA